MVHRRALSRSNTSQFAPAHTDVPHGALSYRRNCSPAPSTGRPAPDGRRAPDPGSPRRRRARALSQPHARLVELVRIRHPEPPQHAPTQPELDQIFVENAGVAVGGPRALRDAARRFASGIGDTSAKRRAGDARLQQSTANRGSTLIFVRTARAANVQQQRWTFSPTTTGRSLISKSTARPAPFFLDVFPTDRCASVAYCIAVGGLRVAAGPAPFYLMFPVIGSEPNRAPKSGMRLRSIIPSSPIAFLSPLQSRLTGGHIFQ
jgi:hypothetical protein